MDSDEAWEQGKIILARNEEERRAREAQKYGKNNSSSGDAELLGVLLVAAGYGIYKGAKFLGKSAVKGGEVAVKGGKLASKTAANAYKLHKGEIEIVNTDNRGHIIEKAPETAPATPQESPNYSKMEKVKEWIGKGIKKSRSASELIGNAYKLTTSTTEQVITDAEDKNKVIIKPSTTDTEEVTFKTKPLLNKQNKYYGEIREDTVTTSLKYKFNNKIVEVIKYKSFTLPDNIMPGEKFELKFDLIQPNGEKIRADDSAHLLIGY